jgi:hypothetical protein
MKERDLQVRFTHWLKEGFGRALLMGKGGAAFELKLVVCPAKKCVGGVCSSRLVPSKIEPGQVEALLRASSYLVSEFSGGEDCSLLGGKSGKVGKGGGVTRVESFSGLLGRGSEMDDVDLVTRVESHRRVEYSSLVYKISDSAIGWKPFDCFVMDGVPGYFVVGWRCGRGGVGVRVYAVAVRS